jgi:hypothetical protein
MRAASLEYQQRFAIYEAGNRNIAMAGEVARAMLL